MASILFFIVGFLHKKRKMYTTSEIISSTGEGTLQVTNDDETVVNQELELKDNVAYGPMQLSSSQPVPVYEVVHPSASVVEHQEQHFELRENVAYCGLTSKSMTTKINDSNNDINFLD